MSRKAAFPALRDLDAARWRRLAELFDRALDLPPDERPGFLERHCDGDASLREQVEALLEAEARARPMLERPVRHYLRDLMAPKERKDAS